MTAAERRRRASRAATPAARAARLAVLEAQLAHRTTPPEPLVWPEKTILHWQRMREIMAREEEAQRTGAAVPPESA